jgi:hypothetical protein
VINKIQFVPELFVDHLHHEKTSLAVVVGLALVYPGLLVVPSFVSVDSMNCKSDFRPIAIDFIMKPGVKIILALHFDMEIPN